MRLANFFRVKKPVSEPTPQYGAISEQASRHHERYNLIPSLAESDRLGLEWHPYIMRRASPCYHSATLNTDSFGFRQCHADEHLISFDHVLSHGGPVGLISGNSTSFGIGASSDANTLPSILNRIGTEALWYNVSHRASNLTQERINLDLYAPHNTKFVVFVSGGNNLIVTLLNEGGSRSCAPFVGEPRFLALNAQALSTVVTMEERYGLMMEATARDFTLIGQKIRYSGWKCLFMLQPFAAWCSREFCAEEKELIDIWDAHPSLLHRVHSPVSILPWRERFVHDMRSLCHENGLDFLDLNTNNEFLRGRWLFADRVHLTDEGHRIIAEIITNRMRSSGAYIAENKLHKAS